MKKQLCETGEMAQRVRALVLSRKIRSVASTLMVAHTHMYHCRGSHALLWPLPASGPRVLHMLAGRHSSTLKNVFKNCVKFYKNIK